MIASMTMRMMQNMNHSIFVKGFGSHFLAFFVVLSLLLKSSSFLNLNVFFLKVMSLHVLVLLLVMSRYSGAFPYS